MKLAKLFNALLLFASLALLVAPSPAKASLYSPIGFDGTPSVGSGQITYLCLIV